MSSPDVIWYAIFVVAGIAISYAGLEVVHLLRRYREVRENVIQSPERSKKSFELEVQSVGDEWVSIPFDPHDPESIRDFLEESEKRSQVGGSSSDVNWFAILVVAGIAITSAGLKFLGLLRAILVVAGVAIIFAVFKSVGLLRKHRVPKRNERSFELFDPHDPESIRDFLEESEKRSQTGGSDDRS